MVTLKQLAKKFSTFYTNLLQKK